MQIPGMQTPDVQTHSMQTFATQTSATQVPVVQVPAQAVATAVLIEVVRISGLPAEPGAPYPGPTVGHWVGDVVADILTRIGELPRSEQHRCGFSPGWGIRAYDDSLDADHVLLEAAFCFSCHEVRMQGTVVPPALATQFFDTGASESQALLARFRTVAS
ncbi:hypothetical protein [Streptomyces sp. PA5.6]|uniref:hypothetical protein n=1 Tax=Streptomyces sp. PA5.6 TaxID=3035651 RepID=UPI003904B3CF